MYTYLNSRNVQDVLKNVNKWRFLHMAPSNS